MERPRGDLEPRAATIEAICPRTGDVVPTGIRLLTDAREAMRTAMRGNAFRCAACGALHVWDKPAGAVTATVR